MADKDFANGLEITAEMLANAPQRPTVSRGRAKGSSPVEKGFRAFYADENRTSWGQAFTNSESAALRTAVCRVGLDKDSSRKSDYEDALSALNLTEVFLGQSGEGNERIVTLALVKDQH